MRKAILLLHGFLSDSNDFDSILPMLEKHYDHIEKITFPGHKQDESYKLFNAEDTIKVLLESFDNLSKTYKDIDVMGYSMGGALAVYLSQEREFNKLILLAPANKYFNFKMPFEKLVVYIKQYRKYISAKINNQVDTLEDTKALLDGLVADDVDSIKFGFNNFFKTYLYGTYRNFRRLIITINKEIENIDNPCFIAWGELDQLVPIESIEDLFNRCTNKIKEKNIYPYLTHLLLYSDLNEDLITALDRFITVKTPKKSKK